MEPTAVRAERFLSEGQKGQRRTAPTKKIDDIVRGARKNLKVSFHYNNLILDEVDTLEYAYLR